VLFSCYLCCSVYCLCVNVYRHRVTTQLQLINKYKIKYIHYHLDVHESVHRDTITKTTNKMQLCRLIYYSLSALHVSSNVFAHHQKHLTVFTASGNIHQCRCRLVSWMSWKSVPIPPPPRFEPRTVQPAASRYTGYAIRAFVRVIPAVNFIQVLEAFKT
jgi:hypothetical protein